MALTMRMPSRTDRIARRIGATALLPTSLARPARASMQLEDAHHRASRLV